MLDLVAIGDVGFDDRFRAQAKFFGERLQAVEAPRAENELRAVFGRAAGGGLAEPAAGAGDDDDFVF